MSDKGRTIYERELPLWEQAYQKGETEDRFGTWLSRMDPSGEGITYYNAHGLRPMPPRTAPVYSHDRWNKMIEAMFDEVRHLAKAKGGEYSGDLDRLANFRRNALDLELPMETVWRVYSAKHWDAIGQFIKDLQSGKQRERLEGIDGRIKDLIVYLLLFNAMVEERNGN